MSQPRPKGGCQTRNRSLIPQKLRHFFSSFPDSYEFPALPTWLLHRPMGSVWCVPKSPQKLTSRRETGRRNRIEPESNAQFLAAPRRRSSRRTSRVADLTYKNTWSSFLKTAKSEQVRFFPLKTPGIPRSLDDSVVDSPISERPRSSSRGGRKYPLSSSPVRRRPVSSAMRPQKKIEAKALREAWLNENVFPQFTHNFSARSAAVFDPLPDPLPTSRRKNSSDYVLREFVQNCTPQRRERYARKSVLRHGSVEANVSSGTTDTLLTPGSMDNSATSTLPTTSGSVNVNATSSPTSSFDSMQARYSVPPPIEEDEPVRNYGRHRYIPDDSLETSQSVEVQVSSTTTGRTPSSASMQPHMSSESSNDFPPQFGNITAEAMAREVLMKERAISSANSRKSCLKGSAKPSKPRRPRVSHFKDPSKLEWTKRYLFTLAPPSSNGTYNNQHDRSSSMSRMSSSDNYREFQVYHVQPRPWQSFPDLRVQKWPAASSSYGLNISSGADDSLDVIDFIKKKKQLLSQLFQTKATEDDSCRSLKHDMRSLALLNNSTYPRCLSAGRSRSSDQYSTGFYGELARLRANTTIASGGSNSNAKIKAIQQKNSNPNDSLTLSEEFGVIKKSNQTCSTIVAPFRFSTENIVKAGEKSLLNSMQFMPSAVEGNIPTLTPPTPRKKQTISSAKIRSPDKRPRSSISKQSSSNIMQSFSAPLQPASGENKASALRKSLTQKQRDDELMKMWQKQQRERERRNRLRAIRLDPAWAHVRGADQAIEDIAHRRCYKEVVERERLLQYHMDKEEMLNRVWQMPPLFERQSKCDKSALMKKEGAQTADQQLETKTTATVNPVNIKFSGNSRKKTSFRTNPKAEDNQDCYLASESLQLSRPSTAKSTKSVSKHA